MSIFDWIRRITQGTSPDLPPTDEEEDIDPYNPFPDPITVEITDIIDLHTIPPRDIKRVVEEYLIEAQARGFLTVRIIHGKGIGVQREIVRNLLAKTSFVDDWTDAPPDAGGLGATIVRLRRGSSERLA